MKYFIENREIFLIVQTNKYFSLFETLVSSPHHSYKTSLKSTADSDQDISRSLPSGNKNLS